MKTTLFAIACGAAATAGACATIEINSESCRFLTKDTVVGSGTISKNGQPSDGGAD